MITCQHAKHLFDRYCDGELSPSLQTELHAHQLSCSGCQGELALLESCGDVIAYDRCEPTLSASFTDRVLLAHRAQSKPAPRRNWARLVISIASPVAAAACIGLAVLLIAPVGNGTNRTQVAGQVDSVSNSTQSVLTGSDSRAVAKSANTREMAPGIVDVILDPMVKQTRNTVDSTKRSFEQLQSLFGLGVAGVQNTLAAGRRNLESDPSPSGLLTAPRPAGSDVFAPPLLPSEAPSAPDAPSGHDFNDTIEAL